MDGVLSEGPNPHPEGSAAHGIFELFRRENRNDDEMLEKVIGGILRASLKE